jgi:hypothetical protein
MAVCIDRLLRSPCLKAPRPIHCVDVPPWQADTLKKSVPWYIYYVKPRLRSTLEENLFTVV